MNVERAVTESRASTKAGLDINSLMQAFPALQVICNDDLCNLYILTFPTLEGCDWTFPCQRSRPGWFKEQSCSSLGNFTLVTFTQ